jgi:hypothetical protein
LASAAQQPVSCFRTKKTPAVQPCSHALRGCCQVDPSGGIEKITDLARSLQMDRLALSTRFQNISVDHFHQRQRSNSNDVHVSFSAAKVKKIEDNFSEIHKDT